VHFLAKLKKVPANPRASLHGGFCLPHNQHRGVRKGKEMSDVVIKASLGFQVISNLRNIRVSKDHFEAVGTSLTDNIFTKYNLRLPSDKEAFARATGTDKAFGPDISFDKVKGADKYTMNLRRSENDDTLWDRVGAVELTKVNNTTQVETIDLTPEATVIFSSKWNECKNTLVTNDISRFFDRVCAGNKAVSLRESGGVWFIPHTCKEEVLESIAAVRQLTGSNSSLLIVNMEDDGDGGEHRSTVTAGVNNDIESAMQAAKAAINDYTEALEAAENDSNLRGPQQRTALRSLKEIKELENKISTYQDILQLKTDNINSTLNAFKDFWKLALGV
jgi:hypothetical protein